MNLIAAVDLNWAIGRDGDQLCYIPADLKRFQALTTGHPVILGRKTLATFPGGRPLKNRRNLILSRDPSFAPEGAEVFRSLEALRAPRQIPSSSGGRASTRPCWTGATRPTSPKSAGRGRGRMPFSLIWTPARTGRWPRRRSPRSTRASPSAM